MNLPNNQFTLDDFQQVDWQEALDNCAKKECFAYSEAFRAKTREAQSSGDERAEKVFRVLAEISGYHFTPSDMHQPFDALRIEGMRTAIPDDLGSEGAEILQQFAPNIAEPELRARVADVVWVVKRDFKSAVLAVNAYLESATKVQDPDQWPACAKRIERALRLSMLLNNEELFNKVVRHIETVLEEYQGTDPLFLSAKMMDLLLEFKAGDSNTCMDIAETAATRAEAEKNWRRARKYWQLKAKWCERAEQTDHRDTALIRAAETHVSEAEQRTSGDNASYLAATFHLRSAIEAFRRIGRQRKRVDELHNHLLEYEKKAVKEFKPITGEIPIEEIINETNKRISGKTLSDAILTLVLLVKSPEIDKLHKQADELIQKYPLSHLFETVVTDRDGKTVGRKPPMISSDPETAAKAKRHEMFTLASQHRMINVHGVIEPARRRIVLEHNITNRDIVEIVTNNPFVPPEHEAIFAQGLCAGFQEDYLSATHLLIPQLENSFRYVLAQHGIRTSKLDQYGIQEDLNLDEILRLPEFDVIFSADIGFDLRGLLVERSGPNLRNRMAHGLMPYGEFYSVSAVYLWWLTLRLCALPLIQHARDTTNPNDNGKAEGKAKN